MDQYARPAQDILNRTRKPPRHWARPERPRRQWIRVRCRINWAHDGNEILDGVAKDWTEAAVCVTVADLRAHGGRVWLEPRDVVRRDQATPLWWRRRVDLDQQRRGRRPG
ncbi:hypothetical protein [Phytoactinopolyspora limicola]|uniref:hypothetical protein n=1 Tax=Phytoactinopolyspora limicola TaxID=2715536 RepID=UPI00140AABEA|nr:hypothetical protein [Phytoactinopolyspora limicola]